MINPLMLLHHQNIAAFCSTTNAAGTVYDFPYTGSVQTITLGKGVYKLEVWGAEGGYRSSQSYSGKGGYSVGTITLTDKETTLYVYSGGSGRSGVISESVYSGGFNGGGYRQYYYGGGGGSDIRVGTDSLYARVIVAGGGGSDGATSRNGMYGGGTSGGAATQNYGSYGYGGTQTGHTTTINMPTTQATTNGTSVSYYGGGFGFGGFGVYRSNGFGGAGGGGWYGGCGAYPDSSGDDDRGGGGGSGYIYTSSTASNYPSGCLLTSKYYLTNASMKAGNTSFTSPTGTSETGHYGNGYCRITCIEGKGAAKPEFVEYIESTGSQYIDTGIIAKSGLTVQIKCTFSDLTKTDNVFGAYNGQNRIYIQYDTTEKFILGYGPYNSINYTLQQNKINNIEAIFKESEQKVFIDGISYYSATSASTYNTTTNALICALGQQSGSPICYHYGRIYFCKIYDNDVLVRDYIPARQNGIFGLWDKVEKKFYGSASNTQFTGG